jgi:ABC-type transport system involved in cytochrome bd biosynthesis fused ATPase/permease subunit
VTPAFAGIAQGVIALTQTERSVFAVTGVVEDARPRRGGAAVSLTVPPRVAFDRVSFRYAGADVDALSQVSFELGRESLVAISGGNGSGKSTCLRLLLALSQPQEGAVRVGGRDIATLDADAWRRRVAFLPQRPYLPPRSDVRTAIRLLGPATPDDRMIAALDRVGVLTSLLRNGADPLAVPVDALSVGQRQRVSLARLLCRDATIYLLDEPDANLDRAGIALVADIVRELATTSSVVLAAHTPELLALAERVITLDAGRLVGDDARPVPVLAGAKA